ncbi:MAG TPA: ornithine cyclodeaminase family protein [Chitinophagaceae bacterium]
MESTETLLLQRHDVARLLTIGECISAVEQAFNLYACGKASAPGILGIHATQGGFHIKAGILNLGRNYFVAKTNANFPGNSKTNRLPTIQGIVSVFDAENGRLLALMDSIEITILRTGAATAVAAKYLSREDSKIVTICGCGNQGEVSLRSLMEVRRLETIYAFDINKQQAELFAKKLSRELKIPVTVVDDPGKAAKRSDICVTCTPSRKPFLRPEDIRPGTFIAAVGADSEGKQELYPEILATGKVVVDLLEQSKKIGEFQHRSQASQDKCITAHAELGEIVAGTKPGRESGEEIIIFDSTGMALQDVAAAAIVYEKAISGNIGNKIDFSMQESGIALLKKKRKGY